jgi:hypothetical protein
MTRPLAVIEHDLSIPLPRPFDGLPPPFGSRRNPMREAVQRVVRGTSGSRARKIFPPGVTHLLVFKLRPRRIDTSLYDAALAEAKLYLEGNNAKPRSSRTDRVLSALIFAGCSIALTWLLITCSTNKVDNKNSIDTTRQVPSIANQRTQQPEAAAGKATANVQSQANRRDPDSPAVAATSGPVDKTKPAKDAVTSSASLMPTQVTQTAPQATQTATKSSRELAAHPGYGTNTQSTTLAKRVTANHLAANRVSERVASNRASHLTMHPKASPQPEWNIATQSSQKQNPNPAENANTPWINWFASQQSRPTMRASTPVDNHWNDHMTQRRITDDPAAFNIEQSAK